MELDGEASYSSEMQFHCFATTVSWKRGTSDFKPLCLSTQQKQKYFWITYIKINISSHVSGNISVEGTWYHLLCAKILLCVCVGGRHMGASALGKDLLDFCCHVLTCPLGLSFRDS